MSAADGLSFGTARRIFALCLGLIAGCAFLSLAVQVRGLCGQRGITPAADFLTAAHSQLGTASYWKIPTVCWLDAGDGTLVGLCLLGIVLSIALAAGFAPGGAALGCWVLYLSLSNVTSPFLDFQWDILLLETTLLAALWLPWSWRPNWSLETIGQRFARWLLWWLLFRLMFESGVVKLTWDDPTWWNLTALDFHFETQPLPLWTAWYAHHAPPWLLRAATLIMFLIEIIVPFALFATRRWRHAAGLALIALQVAILGTGNYAFFNCLSLALCVAIFDDRCWLSQWRQRLSITTVPDVSPRRFAFTAIVASAAALLTIPGLLTAFRLSIPQPLATLRSFNGYGLFRVMTTERPEIVIEGSNDGLVWTEYEFHWKPGDVRRCPGLVAPHQPRVDWQMWFAALGDVRHNPWFVNLLVRTLQGSPEVLACYAWNPFPEKPPHAIRAVRYDYRFTRAGEAGWWHRERRGLYCPPLTLPSGDTLNSPTKLPEPAKRLN